MTTASIERPVGLTAMPETTALAAPGRGRSECERTVVAVAVPAHNEASQITRVVETMPAFVDHIIVIDDASTDDTARIVEQMARREPRVRLIRHDVNRGVGAAIATGYKCALGLNADVVAVMAGDGQMPPDELENLVGPVAHGECEYAKANRLASGEAVRLIPRRRFLGNAVLTFVTKIASGYYQVTDSQTGFTAISAQTLRRIDLDGLYPRYGYPNHMLVMLNVAGARVLDVPSRPVYGIGERSGIRIWRVMPTISWLLMKGFWWRMGMRYVVRDFHPLVLFYVLGTLLLAAGFTLGTALVALRIAGNEITAASAVLVSLAVSSGLMLTLFAMLFDYEHNRALNLGQPWADPPSR